MKRLFTILMTLALFGLAGCMDTQEEVTIKSDGSGVYRTTMDISGMFDMLQMVAMMDTSVNKSVTALANKDVDSIFYLKTFADTSKTLTAEEKQLLQNATVNIKVKQSEKTFRIAFTYPFSKIEEVQKIVDLQQSGRSFNPMTQAAPKAGMPEIGEGDMPSAGSFMNVIYKKGFIERTVDEKKLADLKNSGDMKDLAKAESMLSQITFSTAIRLPSTVRSARGDKIAVSDDKKTVLVKYTAADMIKDPKSLEFRIEY